MLDVLWSFPSLHPSFRTCLAIACAWSIDIHGTGSCWNLDMEIRLNFFLGQPIRSETFRMTLPMFLQRLCCHGLQREHIRQHIMRPTAVLPVLVSPNFRSLCEDFRDSAALVGTLVSTVEDFIVHWKARIFCRVSSKRPSNGFRMNSCHRELHHDTVTPKQPATVRSSGSHLSMPWLSTAL